MPETYSPIPPSNHCNVDTIGIFRTEWSGHPLLREVLGRDVSSACMLLRTVQGSDVNRTANEHVGGDPNIVYRV